MNGHVKNGQSGQNGVAVESALVMLCRAIANRHARQLPEPPSLVNAAGAFHAHVHLLESDEIRLGLCDHGSEAFHVVAAVHALPVMDVVAEHAKRLGLSLRTTSTR